MLLRVSKRKIILKQLAYMLIPCVLTISLVVVSSFNINRSIEEKNRKIYSAMAYEMRMLVENLINESNTMMYSIATDEALFNNLHSIFEHSSITYENLALFRMHQNSLDIVVKVRPYIESLYILPLVEQRSQMVVSAGGPVTTLENSNDRQFLQECLDDISFGSSYILRNKNNLGFANLETQVLSRRQRAMTVDKTKALGDVVINIDTAYIDKIIGKLLGPKSGIAYSITLENDQVIWVSDEMRRNPQLLELTEKENPRKWVKADGMKYALVESFELRDSFKLSLFASKQTLLFNDRRLLLSTLLAIFVSIVVGIVWIVLYTRKKYEDVALFSDYLDALATGGALSPQPIPAERFKDMDTNIVKEFLLSDYVKLHISQKELKERTLELEMLKKQLNPHFLLNTMQMLNYRIMSEMHGYTELNLIVENLTMILSYSLHPTDFLATFAEEEKYTDAYVSLLNRVANRATELTWEIPAPMEEFSIPRQLFQPLVENSLKYAFKGMKREFEGKIVIRAEQVHDDMLVVVSDNGKGIEPEVVDKLNNCFEQELLEGGIGLANTNKRIRLLFGTRFGLHVQSVLGGGTSIEIRLPRIVWKEQN